MATKGPEKAPEGYWSKSTMACVATYNILGSPDLMNQFEKILVPFNDASKFPLKDLASLMQIGLTSADKHGRASQMARSFLKYILTLYTTRTEHGTTSATDVLVTLTNLLLNATATMADLAYVIDEFMIFKGEDK